MTVGALSLEAWVIKIPVGAANNPATQRPVNGLC